MHNSKHLVRGNGLSCPGKYQHEKYECLYQVSLGQALFANRKPNNEIREIMEHAGFFHWVRQSVSRHIISFQYFCLDFPLHSQTTQMKMSPTACWSLEVVLPAPCPPWSHPCHPVYPSLHTAMSVAVPTAHWCSPAPLHPPCLRCHLEVHPDEIPHKEMTQPFPKDPCACHTQTETVLSRSSPCQHAQTPATSLAGKTHNQSKACL